MKSFPRALALSIGVLSIAVAAAGTADLKAKMARQRIADVLGFDRPDPIHIKNISVTGNDAVVEAEFDAAFRFSIDKNGEWVPVELRTGNRQWESLELIQTAIGREKALRTTADLRTIATALEAYRRHRGGYVEATTGGGLIDRLAPDYMKKILRLDAWSHEFEYSGTSAKYRLASNGADGKSGTADDIVFENGDLVKGVTD
jgi:hypothetical protein